MEVLWINLYLISHQSVEIPENHYAIIAMIVYLNTKIRGHKKVTTTTEDKDVVGTFVVNLRGLKTNKLFYKKLPHNEKDINFDEK